MNDIDAIRKAFEPYYRTMLLADEIDPNKLHDLKAALDAFQVYSPHQLEELVRLYLDGADRDRLDPILDACVAVYRVEKQATVKIALPDADTEINPVPTSGGGHKPEPELDRLSNIIRNFNDQFGNIPWTDADRVHKLITEDIPQRVAADRAYQNARKQGDKRKARIEHDAALVRVMVQILSDDTELFKQFSDNPGFKRWLADTVFGLTYEDGNAA